MVDLPQDSFKVTTNDRGQELSTLTYKPKLSDRGKKLTCKYIQNDGTQDIEATNPTVIKINVEKRIIPTSPYTVPQTFEFGTNAKISLDLELNPEPKENDIAWKIKSKDSGNEAMMMIGNTGCSIMKNCKSKKVYLLRNGAFFTLIVKANMRLRRGGFFQFSKNC